MLITVKLVHNDVLLPGRGGEVGLVAGQPKLHVLGDPVVVGEVPVPCVHGGILPAPLTGGKPCVSVKKKRGCSKNHILYVILIKLVAQNMMKCYQRKELLTSVIEF